MRLVLVDEPQRLVRDALVAAIDAAPGLSAFDGSTADLDAVSRADAVVVSDDLLDLGWHRLLADGTWDDGPWPVVIVSDRGPVTPYRPRRGTVVVSRETPLAAVVDSLRNGRGRHDDRPDPRPALTEREHEVLELLAAGLNPAEVARSLSITTYTARDHVKAIREKLGRPTAMAAVLEALRQGLVRLDRV
ncbi:MAG TPA: LuxR C-terminal-related transcriptional regulator [Acidimicrobiales bacterium]|nr:LuxR C-terminal-related transcriptional regulator [Acidimicrobiales bacterium]